MKHTAEFQNRNQMEFHATQVETCNRLVRFLRENDGVFTVNSISVGNNPEMPDDTYIGTFMVKDISILEEARTILASVFTEENSTGGRAAMLNSIDGYQVISEALTQMEGAAVLRIHVKFCRPANLEFTTCLKLSADITVFYKQ